MITPDRLTAEAKRILQPYFDDVDLDRIRLYGKMPWYVIDRPAGYTDRYRIYLDPDLMPGDMIDLFALLAHEIEHTRQYQEYGKWRFRFLYLVSYLKNRFRGLSHQQAYLSIDFEVEACIKEILVAGDLIARADKLPRVIEKEGRETCHV